MSENAPARMNAEQFIARAIEQPEGERYSYFRMPSLRHYVIVNPKRRTAVHHARDLDGVIPTRIGGEDRIELDPPGIVLDRLFGTPD